MGITRKVTDVKNCYGKLVLAFENPNFYKYQQYSFFRIQGSIFELNGSHLIEFRLYDNSPFFNESNIVGKNIDIEVLSASEQKKIIFELFNFKP